MWVCVDVCVCAPIRHRALTESVCISIFWNPWRIHHSFEIPNFSSALLKYRSPTAYLSDRTVGYFAFLKYQTYTKIPNLCKNTKLMQKYQTYAKIPNLCKNTKLMQRSFEIPSSCSAFLKHPMYTPLFRNTWLIQRSFEIPQLNWEHHNSLQNKMKYTANL